MKDQENSCQKQYKEITVRGGKENIEVTLGGKKQTNKKNLQRFEVEKSRAEEMEKKGDGCN